MWGLSTLTARPYRGYMVCDSNLGWYVGHMTGLLGPEVDVAGRWGVTPEVYWRVSTAHFTRLYPNGEEY